MPNTVLENLKQHYYYMLYHIYVHYFVTMCKYYIDRCIQNDNMHIFIVFIYTGIYTYLYKHVL